MNRDMHNAIAKRFGIRENIADIINKEMDFPSKYLGSQHRKYFHGQHKKIIRTKKGKIILTKFKMTKKDLIELYALTGFNPEKVKAWILHLMADGVFKPKVYMSIPKNKKIGR